MIKKHVYQVCWNGKAGKGENQTAVQKGTQTQQETGKKNRFRETRQQITQGKAGVHDTSYKDKRRQRMRGTHRLCAYYASRMYRFG